MKAICSAPMMPKASMSAATASWDRRMVEIATVGESAPTESITVTVMTGAAKTAGQMPSSMAAVRSSARQRDMRIPTALIPRCPACGAPMTMNLRCDDTFVQDEGWYVAQSRYSDFIRRHNHGKVLYLELGVGDHTPVIIKYPFWQYTLENPDAVYACVNFGQAYAPREIAEQSICLDMDIGHMLSELEQKPY